MPIVKNKTTPENRAFWEHVEKVAEHVRANPEIYGNNRMPESESERTAKLAAQGVCVLMQKVKLL